MGVPLRLALQSLRSRLAGSVASFVAVLIGCGLLIASGGMFETAIRLQAPPQALDTTPVVVTGSSGFALPDRESEIVPYAERARLSDEQLTQLRSVEGIDEIVPDSPFPAALTDAGTDDESTTQQLAGHSWDAAPLGGYEVRSGGPPVRTGEVVIDAESADRAGIDPGDGVELAVDGHPQEFTVAGIAAPTRAVDAPAFFFTPEDAAALGTHEGGSTLAGVIPTGGTSPESLAERIDGAVDAVSVHIGEDRGAAEFDNVSGSRLPIILIAAIFGGMVAVVMALVVSATISLTVRQRRRELALLRATGAEPKQVHRMVIAETMVVVVIATVAGAGLGRLIGQGIFSISVDAGVIPQAIEFRQGLIPFAAGIGASLLIGFASAWFAGLPAARMRPILALTEAALPRPRVHPVRRIFAVIMVAGTVALAIMTLIMPAEVAAATGGPAVLTGAIAVGLVAPEVLALTSRVLSRGRHRGSGNASSLAVGNIGARAVAYASVLTPLTLACAVALGNVYSQTTLDHAREDAYADLLHADIVVTGGIDPQVMADAEGLEDAEAITPITTSSGWIEEPYDRRGSDPMRLVGVGAEGEAGSVVASDVVDGSLDDLSGDAMVLPDTLATSLGLGVGDSATVRFGDGTQHTLELVALLDASADYASIVVPFDTLRPHTTTGIAQQLLVTAGDAADTGELSAALTRATDMLPGIEVSSDDAMAPGAAGTDVEAMINYLLALLAIAYAAIATVNAMGVAVLGRRRELALLRVSGATRSEVARMLMREGLILAVIGLALGAVISLFTVIPLAISTGTIVPAGPVWVLLAVIATIAAIVFPVTAIAAGRAMNRPPIDELSSSAA